MPDDLYHRDVLAWSQHQAELLRRFARGERVNDVDWDHVAEEIEDVGLFELHAVESFIQLMFVHLLKVHGWPDSPSANHWQSGIAAFQSNMRRRFVPSMCQRLDLPGLYADALKQIRWITEDDCAPRQWPTTCPIALNLLLTGEMEAMEAVLLAV